MAVASGDFLDSWEASRRVTIFADPDGSTPADWAVDELPIDAAELGAPGVADDPAHAATAQATVIRRISMPRGAL